jgi:hypothetical protein
MTTRAQALQHDLMATLDDERETVERAERSGKLLNRQARMLLRLNARRAFAASLAG